MNIQEEITVFCRNIQHIRKKYYLSEKSMAMLMGIHEEDLLEIESGRLPKHISVEVLFRLQDIFDLPAGEFLTPNCQ